VLSWPTGATCLPSNQFVPGPYDVVIGHVTRCPIHADLRQLEYYGAEQVVLDAGHRFGTRRRPLLRLHRLDHRADGEQAHGSGTVFTRAGLA
jgi:hypothetical protein